MGCSDDKWFYPMESASGINMHQEPLSPMEQLDIVELRPLQRPEGATQIAQGCQNRLVDVCAFWY